LGEGGFS